MTESFRGSKKSLWAWVPVVLLGSMLCGLGALAYIATGDPHFALEPDYYDKAVHWDRARGEQRESDASGVKAELAPLVIGADGRALVRVALVDAARKPLRGARVRIEAFPNAYATRLVRLELRESEPGVYVASLERPIAGLWELRLEAADGGRRFREVLRRDVSKPVRS